MVQSAQRRGSTGLVVGPPKKSPMGLTALDKPCAEHTLPIGLSGLVVERKPSTLYGRHRLPTKFDASVGGGGGGSGGLDLPVRPVLRHSFSPSVGKELQALSPERLYLGVGHLIDEWQCKTVDAESLWSPIS